MSAQCTICTGSLNRGPLDLPDGESGRFSTAAIALPCGHIFHRFCVEQWFNSGSLSSSVGTCPNCQSTHRLSQALTVFPSFDGNVDDITAQVGQMRRLREENAQLKGKVEELEETVSELESLLQDGLKEQEEMRNEFELKEKVLKDMVQKGSRSVGSDARVGVVVKEVVDCAKWEILEQMRLDRDAIMSEVKNLKRQDGPVQTGNVAKEVQRGLVPSQNKGGGGDLRVQGSTPTPEIPPRKATTSRAAAGLVGRQDVKQSTLNKTMTTPNVPTSPVALTTQLPPLLIHLSGDCIKAGVVSLSGDLTLLEYGNGQVLIPALVAWSDGRFYLGEEAMKQPLHRRQWKLLNFLLRESEMRPFQEIVGADLKVNFEFLLALFLRKVKTILEKEYKGNCSTAIIAHPFFLCSTQKLQVKNGAEAAGFGEVYLVNELHAAALAFAKAKPGKNIMALGVSDLWLDAIVFHNTLDFSQSDYRFVGEPLRELYGSRTENTNPLRSSRSYPSLAEAADKICNAVLQVVRFKPESMSRRDPDAFVLCENVEARKFLELAWRPGGGSARFDEQGNSSNLVMEGLLLLKNDPRNSDKLLRFTTEWPIHAHHWGYGSAEGSKAIPSGQILPTQKSFQIYRKSKGMDLYESVFQSKFSIGTLEVGMGERRGVIIPTFEVNSEGIMTLKDVKVRKGKKLEALLEPRGYTWHTPNLRREEVDGVRGVLSQVNPEFGRAGFFNVVGPTPGSRSSRPLS